MSSEVATLVHYLILAAGTVTWLFALWYHRRAFRSVDPRDPTLLSDTEVEIRAGADQVMAKAVEALRVGGLGGAGSVKLEEAEDHRITGDATFFAPKGKGGGGTLRFEIELNERRDTTTARLRLFGSGSSGLQRASAFFVYFLSPAALIAAAILIPKYVLHHEKPDVRAQAFQTFQVVHVLWEPFLFGYLRRKIVTVVETSLTNVLENTAF